MVITVDFDIIPSHFLCLSTPFIISGINKGLWELGPPFFSQTWLMCPDSRYMRSGHRVTSKQLPWLRCCFSWQVAQERRLILITQPVSHEGRQTLVLVTCVCIHTHMHTCTHAHTRSKSAFLFPIQAAAMSVIFLLAHTSFSSSLLFVQGLHNCGWHFQMTLFSPLMPRSGYKI